MNLKEKIITEIKKIFDPEIPVNIYDLGLIYEIIIDDSKNVKVNMTLTSPSCPVAESLPVDVKKCVEGVDGVKEVELKLVWAPPWNSGMMTEAAKLELNL
jgi:FeS assembly SUF system protein|tara:strand:- start:678 stop:977 length:300 start_codon:yes stop_codon:yes gene_type:complete